FRGSAISEAKFQSEAGTGRRDFKSARIHLLLPRGGLGLIPHFVAVSFPWVRGGAKLRPAEWCRVCRRAHRAAGRIAARTLPLGAPRAGIFHCAAESSAHR